MVVFKECLGRTPFASLLATFIVVIGTAVFCGTSYKALQLTVIGIFNNLFDYSLDWLQVLQVMFVVIGSVMGGYALILLIFGFLATGATRSNIYSGAKCIMGGRITAAFFMVLSYIFTLGWMAIFALAMVPVVGYIATDSICEEEIYSKTAQELQDSKYTFKLDRFGIYSDNDKDITDHTELRELCNKVQEAGPLFCIALGTCGLIVIGMIHFLITLAANYTRIKISRELTDYRDAVEMEELDLSQSSKKGPPPYRDGIPYRDGTIDL
ncbi:hypothetical protein EGW08_005003 [Elysia chlorotica]|uniref:Uncharacterized protein n=1 Tax=Elysia chlorotica TaxID=188477 RepID=A0A3S1BMR7_ELYCH|nr:hypothetical protein EGW08_005003 [Elysia chlorotica]